MADPMVLDPPSYKWGGGRRTNDVPNHMDEKGVADQMPSISQSHG